MIGSLSPLFSPRVEPFLCINSMYTGRLSYDLEPDSPFSYTCNQCGKCCHRQRIMLTPYEILRLARNLGISTGEFIAKHTIESATVLRFRSDNGACSLLGEQGCSVHSDRPFVCRIYPLGSLARSSGEKRFALLKPHPESLGFYGNAETLKPGETVSSFLDSQGIAPYLQARQLYAAVFDRLMELLARIISRQTSQGDSSGFSQDGLDATEWFDVDAVLKSFCSRHNLALPEDVERQTELHIRALEEWADSLEQAISS